MQTFVVFFIGAFAFVNAGVIVEEHHVVNTPFEKTSIVGPSGSITQEKNVPFVETKLHEVVPAVKVIEPVGVETVAPVVHHVTHPVFRSFPSAFPEYHIAPEYPVVPSFYSNPFFRSYYPYYNYFPHQFL